MTSRHNHCTGDGCERCRLYDSGERDAGWWRAIGGFATPPAPADRSDCVRRGASLRTVECPSCGGHVKAKTFACALHGECTPFGRPIPGVAGCRSCPDYAPPARVTVNMGAGGIGDAILGLVATRGLQLMGRRVAYGVHPDAMPFVRLFEGWDELFVHVHDQTRDAVPPGGADVQLNLGYNAEVRTRAARPRWQRYCDNAGGVTPTLPGLRDRDRLLALGRPYAGRVLLCPFSMFPDREWSIHSWRTTERLLREAGHRPLVVDSRDDRARLLASERLVGAPAEVVAGAMLQSLCVVGIDSGPAHLAGLLGVRTLVLTGKTSGQPIFGFYPAATCLAGALDCHGCWWQGQYEESRCKQSCAAMTAIQPAEVLRLVNESMPPPHATLLSRDRITVLYRSARETAHLPGDMAEVGVFKGGSSLMMCEGAPGKRMHLFDTFAGLPQTCPEGIHVAGDFACGLDEVRALLEGKDVEYHVGLFPDTAAGMDDVRYSCVHVDGDLYETTRAAIDYFWPRLVPGGVLLFDDYRWPNTPGVTRAIDAAFPPAMVETPASFQAVIRKPL